MIGRQLSYLPIELRQERFLFGKRAFPQQPFGVALSSLYVRNAGRAGVHNQILGEKVARIYRDFHRPTPILKMLNTAQYSSSYRTFQYPVCRSRVPNLFL